MKETVNSVKFDSLINLFEQTHSELQKRAARSVDIALVVRNWLFGMYIVEFENGGAERAEIYGKVLLEKLALNLKQKGIKGLSTTNLKLCRSFYLSFKKISLTLSDQSLVGENQGKKIQQTSVKSSIEDKISQTLSGESFPEIFEEPELLKQMIINLAERFSLGWSHYVILLTIENIDERSFYEIEAVSNAWSVRELKRQIESSLYQRLALSRDKTQIKELSEKGQVIGSPADIIKNPYVLEFLDLKEENVYSEYDLETAIINKLEHFLLELGKGFLFEARQKRLTFDDDHFYVDLVFYNRLLKCYVLIDLKRDKLTHQDLGQMQMYVNYYNKFVKLEDEAPTIGILLCHRKNNALVELTLPENSNIYASKYQLYLPSKEELIEQVEKSIKEIEER